MIVATVTFFPSCRLCHHRRLVDLIDLVSTGSTLKSAGVGAWLKTHARAGLVLSNFDSSILPSVAHTRIAFTGGIQSSMIFFGWTKLAYMLLSMHALNVMCVSSADNGPDQEAWSGTAMADTGLPRSAPLNRLQQTVGTSRSTKTTNAQTTEHLSFKPSVPAGADKALPDVPLKIALAHNKRYVCMYCII